MYLLFLLWTVYLVSVNTGIPCLDEYQAGTKYKSVYIKPHAAGLINYGMIMHAW